MAQKVKAPMPEGMDLGESWQLLFLAVDATSGAAVSGVKISQAGLLVTQVGGGTPEQLQSGPFMLVPGPNT